MKKIDFLLVALAVLVSSFSLAQSTSHNYINTTELLEPVDIATYNTSSTAIKKIETVTYLDGFGKVKQKVGIKQTATQKDVIQHVEYDEFGRISKQYLPFPTSQNTGDFVINPISLVNTYYQTNFADQNPFSQTIFDDSPLNRVVETSSPGNTWKIVTGSDLDHTSKFTYGTNQSEEVKQFTIDDLNSTFPPQWSYYAPNTLLKRSVKNENWAPTDGLLNTKDVFSDKNGRKIVEFTYELVSGSVKKLSTYYVYDDIGNLLYIITPKGIESLYKQVNYNPFSLTYSWQDFVVNPSSVTNGSGVVTADLQVITVSGSNQGSFTLDFNLNFPVVFPSGGGAILKQGNVVSIPANSNLPNNTYLFSVYSSKRGEIVLEEVDGVGGNSQYSRYEFSIKDGYIFVEFKIGTDPLSPTSPFIVRTIDQTVVKIFDAVVYNAQMLEDLAYQYKYDIYNRQIEQKVPGKDWEYMVYDQLDRPILTQDANLRAQNKWLFKKYDVFGRVIYSGLYSSSASRAALQTQVDNFINTHPLNASNIEEKSVSALLIGGITVNYTNNAFPNTSTELLTVNYYDDYNFSDASLPSPLPTSILGQSVTTSTKGLLTSSWTKTIGSSNWAKNYTFYDQKGRAIYVYDKNYVDGYTKNESRLDFRGKTEESITKHRRVSTSAELTINDFFEYDHVERPKKHYQKINSQQQELISEQEYDELGQLKSKKVGGAITNANPLQKIDFTYNIRGWLKSINDINNLSNDLFAYQIKYDEAIEGNASFSNVFNGNIKQVIWKSAINNIKKSYAYEYDKLNRFVKSNYRDGATLTSNAGKFETFDTHYDPNGNITELKRHNQLGILMDRLIYNYDDGNQLMYIDDTAATNTDGFYDGNTSDDDYTYDTNGNLITDRNKNITSIEYNHLDLVKKVTFSNGNIIDFIYDANGRKLQMKTIISGGATTTIDYFGGFQYINNLLQFFPTPEGYASANGIAFKYVYIYKDHLGNNRLSFSDNDGSGNVSANEIQSNTDYYVMGLTHHGEFVSNSNYNYKYQGKEQLLSAGYNMYDFGSRMYDASVGRWFNTDPQNQFASPYLAMGNNWVISTDPNGEIVPVVIIVGAAVIGGAINVAANWDRIDNFWEGLGHFGTGAGTGVASVTLGPAGTIGASAIGGALDEMIQGGDVNQVIRGGVQSGFGSAVGMGVGKYVGKYSNILLNKYDVTSPFLKNVIGGTIGGGIGGGITGGLFSSANGQSFGNGFVQGAKRGAISGGISAGGQSIVNGYAHNVDPFSGKSRGINDIQITQDGINKIKRYLSDPRSGLDYDLANDVMINRLENIQSGKIQATNTDLYYYTHEIREMYLRNFQGLDYESSHNKSLNDFNASFKDLYTPDALKAGDAYWDWKATTKF